MVASLVIAAALLAPMVSHAEAPGCAVAAILAAAGPDPEVTLLEGRVAHWEFEGGWTDSSGYGRTLSGDGNTWIVGTSPDGSASCMYSNGNSVRQSTGWDLDGYASWSVALWAYRQSHTSATPVCLSSGWYTAGGFSLFMTEAVDDRITAALGSGLGWSGTCDNSGSGGSTLLKWSHYAATYDGTTLRLYRDGTQVGTVTAGYVNTGHNKVVLAQNSSAEATTRFKGYMDDVRVYSRVLSVVEIKHLAGL